ncbi:Argininosuccinate synthase [Buchnera aphidicola (Tetraneura ulmi)]|uniref:argininosuccinate synthase n=1 Tax=Buchnera aphidicola TaxID=9 RepID=UPI003463A959
MKKIKKTVVLAYSGGLDTSVIIPWIIENYNFEVVAFVADVGQSRKDLLGIEEKALKSGAKSVYISDLREEFIKNYIYPMLQSGSIYENGYLLGTAIARPVIAKAQVELAKKINADFLSHGSTGKGNDQVRFESTYAALSSQFNVIAPWREWDFSSREDLLNYLNKKKISTTATAKKIYSRDENIFHISTEGGELEDLSKSPSKNCWTWTSSLKSSASSPESVSIKIENGRIISIDNKKTTLLDSLEYLNKIGSKHGIGRIDIVENRLIGMKSRGCYETPGGTIINKVLRTIEELVLDRDSLRWRSMIGLEMSYLIYDGKWFTPLRQSILSALTPFIKLLNGCVELELYKGSITIKKRYSKNSLYARDFATFGKEKTFNQFDANGFIRIHSLSSRIRNLKKI